MNNTGDIPFNKATSSMFEINSQFDSKYDITEAAEEEQDDDDAPQLNKQTAQSLKKNINELDGDDLINVCSATPKEFQIYMSKHFGEQQYTEGFKIIEQNYSDFVYLDDSEQLFADSIKHLNFANDH